MIISNNQKRVLLNEAAKQALRDSNLLNIGESFSKLLGVSDMDVRQYGTPLAPIYLAKTGELIEIPRIANFFTGLARDYQVVDASLTELENILTMLNIELWAKMQLLKNRAITLSKTAQTERLRNATGSLWSFTETYTTTNHIDMTQSSVWLDASEGVIFLPMGGDDQNVPPYHIQISDETAPVGGSFLTSDAYMAFDGLESTNWRAWFSLSDTVASCVADLTQPRDLTSITIDPVGFGIDLSIDVETQGTWVNVVKSMVYNKKTFPIDAKLVTRVRVSYGVADVVLPKAVGIRSITLFSSPSTRFATAYSKLLRPTFPFTEVRLDLTTKIPNGAKVIPYYSTDGTNWSVIQPGDWHSLSNTITRNVNIDAPTFGQSDNYRGIYSIAIGTPSASDGEGELEIGTNQIEISAFRKDWTEFGDVPKQLTPELFTNENLVKCWTDVRKINFDISAVSERVLQNYGEDITDSPQNISRGNVVVFQRKVSSRVYNEMCMVPLLGSVTDNTMQFNHNYRMKFQVYANRDIFYDDGKYWFLQGYRTPDTRNYREIGKSYGAFTMFINGQLVANDSAPYTIYTDGTYETGVDTGKPLIIKLNEGWNTVEILVNIIDPSIYYQDAFEQGDPYLQLSLEPCFFDPEFQSDMGITKILASGIERPSSEFDLIWNLPKDLTFWAWSEDRSAILFNDNKTRAIDGFYVGNVPSYNLIYRGADQNAASSNLYVRLDLEREDSSRSGPIVEEYKVMVR